MNFFDVIASRRSVRAYERTPVSREKLERILEAARQAPSAANRQPWKMYVIEDAGLREEMGKAYRNPWFYEAPAIVVICTVPDLAWKRGDGKNYGDVDATIAFDHLTLAAHAEGLATCWVGAFNAAVVREVLRLPPGEEPLAMTPLGIAAQKPRATGRKPLAELVEFR
jgi:nitroreductase